MNNEINELVQVTLSSMLESEYAMSCFEEPTQNHLRCLVRLTIEFDHYLKMGNLQLREKVNNYQKCFNGQIQRDKLEMEYCLDSIFSGIDSFCAVNAAYRVLVGSISSKVEWNMVSTKMWRNQFDFMFQEFIKEPDFLIKCRLLLDLFKLQIVFAGVMYN